MKVGQDYIDIIESKEFKDFVRKVEKHEGRATDSVTVCDGCILVDGWSYCVPGLSNRGNLSYYPLNKE